MKWLIIYDIKDAKRLSKIAKLMLNYSIRVQKSVFEAIADYSVIEELRIQVRSVIEPEDYVVYFKICDSDWQKREKFGVGSKIELEQNEFRIL